MKPVAARQSVGDFRLWGNYTGPGNRTDPEYLERYPPVDALDVASKRHDLYYGREAPGRYSYLKYNKADEAFLEDLKKVHGWRARLAEGFFKAKRAVAPRMKETPGTPARSGRKHGRTPHSREEKHWYARSTGQKYKGLMGRVSVKRPRLVGPTYGPFPLRARRQIGFGGASDSFMRTGSPYGVPVTPSRPTEGKNFFFIVL